MSTSIRVSEETKRKLEAIKEEGETFDELLDRLTVDRTKADVREMAGFGGEGVGEEMESARDELNESLEERAGQ